MNTQTKIRAIITGATGMVLKEGYIALQAESHPIDFRQVELLNLKGCMNKSCKSYRPYFVVAGECDCTTKPKGKQ